MQFIKACGAAGVSEIGRELDLPKSTVHRVLVALTNKGLVQQNQDTKRYSLGPGLLELAFPVTQNWDIVSIATPYLSSLRDSTGETAELAVKFGLTYAYMAQAASPHEHRVNPVLGKHYPLHWAASGKAILAHVSENELAECLRIVPFSRATASTVTDTDDLLRQLEEGRRVGYFVSYGERMIGAAAVAAPVLDRHDLAHAALSVAAPESRLREVDIQALAQSLIQACHAVALASASMGIAY